MNYVLDFRESNGGGAVTGGILSILPHGPQRQGAEDLLRAEKRALFLIHGYNVDRQDGELRLGNLAQFIPHSDDSAVVSVIWPGDHWTGVLSYPFEGRDADDTADALAKFIDFALSKGVPVSFVTHSLGARVALETAKRIDQGDRNRVEQICLMAPAIDNFSLAAADFYLRPVANAKRVAVLSSVGDSVLKYAYPAGDLLQAFIYCSDVAGSALGYRGPIPYDIGGTDIPANVQHSPIPESRDADHGDYLPEFGPASVPQDSQQRNQRSAALFANEVICGVVSPRYS